MSSGSEWFPARISAASAASDCIGRIVAAAKALRNRAASAVNLPPVPNANAGCQLQHPPRDGNELDLLFRGARPHPVVARIVLQLDKAQ